MNQTTNYKLPQWVEDDRIMMEDFNDAMAKIDAGIAGAIQESATLGSSMAALAARVGAAGRTCRIAWGSYTGTGTCGAGNPNTIVPGFYPVLVCVGSPSDDIYMTWPWFMVRPCAKAQGPTGRAIDVAWSDTAVSWYGDQDTIQQMNQPGTVYYYAVLGYDKAAETAE